MPYNAVQAGMEGWGVFSVDGGTFVIQRIDDMSVFYEHGDGKPVFVDDDDALAFVQAEAARGDENAKAALECVTQEQGGTAIAREYVVTVDYQTAAGSPSSKRFRVVAGTDDEAMSIANKLACRRAKPMKIVGGTVEAA